MNTQQPIIDGRNADVPGLLVADRRRDTLLFIVIVVVLFSLTPLLILAGVTVGYSVVLALLGALTGAALVVRWPMLGFFVVITCTVLIEQTPLTTAHILTDTLFVYYWPASLAGLIERPIGFLFMLILFAFVCHRFVKRRWLLRGGALLGPFVFFLLCVAWGMVHGVTSGGDFKTVVLEVRPFLYLFESYLLAYNMVTHKNHIKAFFWVVIVGAGVKGIQGCYIYYIVLHQSLSGQNEIMAHEDSFFFAALILLVILFCMHYRYRAQLYAAMIALPGVVITLIANERRADYVALLVGLMVAWTLVFCVEKRARKALLTGMIAFLVLGTAYVALFSHGTGGFAAPARAVVTIISPTTTDPRDASSNLYRTIEDFDLKYTVKQNPVLGYGFGKPFLQPELLPNIISLDPYYLYIPHNTIYWVWMRLGPVGFLALWYIIGAVIVRGCIIVRQLQDRYLQLVAIYAVAVTFMEVIVAFADYQLFFYRNVIYLGLLIGILMKLPELDKKPELDRNKEQTVHETAHGVREFPVSHVGSGNAQLLPAEDSRKQKYRLIAGIGG